MLALIAVELLPRAYGGGARIGPSVGILAGAGAMLALSAALGV
jgi:hypothetical protein